MSEEQVLPRLENALHQELTGEILPFWMNHMVDQQHGGFLGRIDSADTPQPEADKGAILNARILWTFSAAYNEFGGPEYLEMAHRAYLYISRYFLDAEYGGSYWMLDYTGKPVNTQKHLYVQAFMLYGLSEYYKATSRPGALQACINLFRLIEEQCYEPGCNGYHEVFDRQWNPLTGVALGEDEEASKFTMNSHLHLLEAYANLLKTYREEHLARKLGNLIRLHLDYIYDRKLHHFYSFFRQDWSPQVGEYSYGHDIEAVWLMYDAARLLDNPKLIEELEPVIRDVADVTIREGIDPVHGGIYNAGENGEVTDTDKQWWPQVEGIIGFGYAWHVTDNPGYLRKAEELWDVIKRYFRDSENGEWHFKVSEDGRPDPEEDKAGPWKGPYHTARCCMEFSRIARSAGVEDKP